MREFVFCERPPSISESMSVGAGEYGTLEVPLAGLECWKMSQTFDTVLVMTIRFWSISHLLCTMVMAMLEWPFKSGCRRRNEGSEVSRVACGCRDVC